MIQLISFEGKTNIKGEGIVVNSLNSPRSFDEFDINVIDLSNEYIWRCDNDSKIEINCIKDFKSLNHMIVNKSKTFILILLPQNLTFEYDWGYLSNGKGYRSHEELKNMIPEFIKIFNNLFKGLDYNNVFYENTRTEIEGKKYAASFYYETNDSVTKSIGGNKATTIKVDDIYFSFLNIENADNLNAFLKCIGILKPREDRPGWFDTLEYFDDNVQKANISESKRIIDDENQKIKEAEIVLENNDRYKSILYTTGDELVEVIFDIIQELWDVDLSGFEDERNEDFVFEHNGNIYIGEIKGVNHNIKNENISQLDVHVQGYLDAHPEVSEDRIIALLIMNHQKNKEPNKREPVHERQIKLAERNGCLIVETPVLLDIYSKYRNDILTKQELLEIFKSKGLLKIN